MFKKKKKEKEDKSQFDFGSYYNSVNSDQANRNNQINYNNYNQNNSHKANNLNNIYNNSAFDQYFQNGGNPNAIQNNSSKKKSDGKGGKIIKAIILITLSIVLIVTLVILFFTYKDSIPFLNNKLITLDSKLIQLGVNNKKTLTYKYKNPEQTVEVKFKSENPEIASIDDNGVITTHKEGNTVIIAYYIENGKEKQVKCKVIVGKGKYPACTLSLNSNTVKANVSNATEYGFNENYDKQTTYTLEIPTSSSAKGEQDIKVNYFVRDNDGISSSCELNVKRSCTCKYTSTSGKCYRNIKQQRDVSKYYSIYGGTYGSSYANTIIKSICRDADYIDNQMCYWYSDEGVDCTFSAS